METLIRHGILWCLIWVCAICLSHIKARHIWVKMHLIRVAEIWEVDCWNNLPSESAQGTSDLSKFINMKILQIKLGKERQCHITKQLVHSFSINIRICQPKNSDVHLGFASVNITVLGLTNPDVNLKRMHQLYNERATYCLWDKTRLNVVSCILLEINLTENWKVVFCLPFICKHKETVVKTIRCNLTIACRIFKNFTESLYKNIGILP